MKQLSLLSLALVAAAATARTPVENMQEQCRWAMDAGTCRVALDPKMYPNPTVKIGSIGSVPTADYLRVRNTGEKKEADGSWTMCARIKSACGANMEKRESSDCRTYRFLFKQDDPKASPPGSNSAKTIKP